MKFNLPCSSCGKDRYMTKASLYEANRLGRTICKSCTMRGKKRGTKYDKEVYVGKIFGKLKVVGNIDTTKSTKVECECECGKRIKIHPKKLVDEQIFNACKECKVGTLSPNWKGIGDMPMTIYTRIKLRAKTRRILFDVSPEYISSLFDMQDGKCAITGIPISFIEEGKNLADSKTTSASLDRIDSNVGYVKGNLQWVHKHINSMKNEHDMTYFIDLCKKVVEYDKSRNTRK